jgi:signal transduction histidine kinase
MAAGIVHDFRNILSAMASGARLIRSRACDGALTPILDEMDAAVERGADLASKLLTVSRQQDLALEVVDINQLLSALEPLLKIAAGSGIRLRLKLAPEVWPCRLDRAQFDGALLNLILNARDAMPNGGHVRVASANAARPAGIGWAARAVGDYVCITVADTGQGMPSRVAQRVLEPFYTTKGDAGTGLGLSQVYGFVRQVGGDLRIKSQPGAGTTVELFFPRCVPARAREVDHTEAADAARARHDQTGEPRSDYACGGWAGFPAPVF